MKRKLVLSIFICFLICIPLFAKDAYISVGTAKVKARPSVWDKTVELFNYGDLVIVLEDKGGWIKVSDKDGKKEGWIMRTCVTDKKLKRKGRASADASELSLAGKGFSEDFEAEYSDLYNIDFFPVDEMEKINFTADDLKEFMIKGNLTVKE